MADLLPPERPAIMGILNVTPDSFSDGGRFAARDAAMRQAMAMIDQGANIIDIGGESTRPGSDPVSEAEELDRVIPVIEALRAESATPVSIDTMKPAVARAAIGAGANIWNDVTALRFADDSPATAAELGVPIVLMHMRGDPKTMQADLAPYDDVVADVAAFLTGRAGAAEAAGVSRENIWLDPGIGFGKSLEDNLALTRGLRQVSDLGFPVLYGASRKRFIALLDPAADSVADRLGGSVAAAIAAAQGGARVLRVHDVAETAQALKVWRAIKDRKT
ncbi:dihydropteroate synthase [Euryhalocaulis caribicus]|uniref:dihydropteroate synthase n=1 Tax=Euryhalocaulis caribicus TaxID=1161401 RepID=UPI0003A7F596|nr:dihydropteroate synthase [Euryhalocaulis caribicus]